ncbi:hypothetical protein OY671_010069 [Metschnikowia pulcherrima]|nr:hypothetical protein OY671_010069 [Metschnikowia pulcherrima]
MAEKNAEDTISLEKPLGPLDHGRITGKWPVSQDGFVKVPPHPIGKRIAHACADAAGNKQRPEGKPARPEQAADAQKDDRGGNKQGEQGQRFNQAERKDDDRRPFFMLPREGNRGFDNIGKIHCA